MSEAPRGISRRRILTSFGSVSMLTLLGQIVAFGSSVVLAHRLEIELFGMLALSNAIASYVGLVGRFGSEVTMVREIGAVPDPGREFLELARARQSLALMIALLTAAGALFFDGVTVRSVLIGLAALGAATIVADPGPLFDLKQRTASHAGYALLRQVAFSGAAIGAVLLLPSASAALTLTAIRIPLGILFIALTLRACAISPMALLRFAPAGSIGRSMRANVRPFFALLAHQIYLNSDQLLIASWLGEAALAPYAVAVSLAQAGLVASGALHRLLNPAIVAAVQRNDAPRQFRRALSLCVAVCGLLSIGFWIAAPLVLRGFYPAAMASARDYVPPLALWIFLSGLGGFLAYVLLALGSDRRYLIAVVAGAIANLSLNLVAIPRYGALGAAWTTVIAQGLATAIALSGTFRLWPRGAA